MNGSMSRLNPFSLSKRTGRPLILDGAVGSFLQFRKNISGGKYWTSIANVKYPDKVLSLHRAYIEAGCDIITTNTFRSNPEAAIEGGINFSALVKEGVRIAKQAVAGLPVLIAGSNAPAEDCYDPKRTLSLKRLEANHRKHIDGLISEGCDFVLNETQGHFDEIRIICKYCSLNNIPYVLSLYTTENLKLLSGEDVFTAIEFAGDYNPLAISFNCISPVTFRKIYRKINPEINWGYYLNCGGSSISSQKISGIIRPSEYSEIALRSLRKYPSFVGACCGSSPTHIKTLKKLFHLPSGKKNG